VRDLLELSRLDAGATETVMEPIDVRELAGRVMARHGFSDVPLHAAGDSEQVRAMGDRRRIERVLVNLLENARDHGGGATSVTVRSSGRHVELVVADNGPGIAVSERSAIFQRFARGTASRSGTGSGLGLAIVLEHARAMGGGVRAEESPAGGAQFTVTLLQDDDQGWVAPESQEPPS
jgi:signal transduction histidine kinase